MNVAYSDWRCSMSVASPEEWDTASKEIQALMTV